LRHLKQPFKVEFIEAIAPKFLQRESGWTMWSNNKQSQPESNATPSPSFQPPAATNFNSSPAPASSAPNRAAAPAANYGNAKQTATLGPGLTIKGQISGDEDLHIEGKVEGPITLKGQRLTVGKTGEVVSDVQAKEVVVYGKVRGNLHASDRVEVKNEGSVVGNITGGRVLIEDGAYLKGQIEIERGKNHGSSSSSSDKHELETVGAN
jgi:cytoskeletal protein CcmA (bactofilin family)